MAPRAQNPRPRYAVWHAAAGLLHLLVNVVGGVIAYATSNDPRRDFTYQIYPYDGSPASLRTSYGFDFFWLLCVAVLVQMLAHFLCAWLATRASNADVAPTRRKLGGSDRESLVAVAGATRDADATLFDSWMSRHTNPGRWIARALAFPMLLVTIARFSSFMCAEILAVLYFLHFAGIVAGYWQETASHASEDSDSFESVAPAATFLGILCTTVAWAMYDVVFTRVASQVAVEPWAYLLIIASSVLFAVISFMPFVRQFAGPSGYGGFERFNVVLDFFLVTFLFWASVGGLRA